MMKIKNITLSFCILCILLLISCSDALDIAPDGRITEDDVFTDNDKVAANLNTCYSNVPKKGIGYYNVCRGPVVWSDEAWDANIATVSDDPTGLLNDGNASASSFPITNIGNGNYDYNYWNRYWVSIRYCTVFLSRISTATVTLEKDRNRWTAEAHLLRAFYYAELLRWFGCGLPIERNSYDYTGDFSTIKRSSFYEVVQFIIEDCDAALSCDDLPWRITSGGEAGRLTKALAEAIKARMILYAASPLYNDGEDHWKEAFSVIGKSLNNLEDHGYQLYNALQDRDTYLGGRAYLPNKYAALYNEYFTNSMSYSSTGADKETIFQSFSTVFDAQIYNVDAIGGDYGGTFPSQELVDAYETTNGLTILDLENPYQDKETHLIPNYNTENNLYDPANPYKNRDPRFYASIYYNGSQRYQYWGFEETAECLENYSEGDDNLAGNRTRIIATWVGEPKTGKSDDSFFTRTSYYQRKFLHPNSSPVNPVSGAPFKQYRLGEVILNYAEAAAEAGHYVEAKAAVDRIRERVGMPKLSSGLSPAQLILRIHHERQVELAMEEARYFDVRRWSKPTGDLALTDRWVTAMKITPKKVNGVINYTYERVPVRSTERKCYTNKYLKCPIPMDEVNLMLSLTGDNWQNPGW